MSPAIVLSQVSKRYPSTAGRAITALQEISLAIQAGECLVIVGTSGSGKSTLLRLLNRTLVPSSGKVTIFGKDIADWNLFQLRRSFGYVLQHGGLFPHLSVEQNISLLGRIEGYTKEEQTRRVRLLMSAVRLPYESFAGRYPVELSGGQQQRVGVARALFLDPPIMLMDEPFGALDPLTRSELHKEFIQLKATLGKTIILITHDIGEAFTFGDKIAILDEGRLVQCADPATLRSTPNSEFVRDFISDSR